MPISQSPIEAVVKPKTNATDLIKTLRINLWPKSERPREKLLAAGPECLSDAELLAIFIRNGAAGKTAVDLARELLTRHRSLGTLLHVSCKQLCEIRGIGIAKAVQLSAISELAKRALAEQLVHHQACLHSPQAVGNYLKLSIGAQSREIFMCLYLDAQNRLIYAREMARGSLTQTAIYPREIIKEALQANAAGIIIAHNHPSGDLEPSPADIQITQHLKKLLDFMEIRLLDHLIVCSHSTLSFCEQGLL